jgi:hypothetical protein
VKQGNLQIRQFSKTIYRSSQKRTIFYSVSSFTQNNVYNFHAVVLTDRDFLCKNILLKKECAIRISSWIMKNDKAYIIKIGQLLSSLFKIPYEKKNYLK